jgi:zinc protease
LYLRPGLMHTGFVLPLGDEEREYWSLLQAQADQEDVSILSNKVRTADIEEGRVVHTIETRDFTSFAYPKAEIYTLRNGLEIIYYHDNRIPKIEMILEFKADELHDPLDKEGLSNFVSKMMTRGTHRYSADEFAEQIEQKGMSLTSTSGIISMSLLSKDFIHGLSMLRDILTEASFDDTVIEKVRQRLHTDITDYWDQPYQFCNDLIRKLIYKNHPYQKNVLGTRDSITAIARDDLLDFYQRFITPHGARLVLVGDIPTSTLVATLEDIFASWDGPIVSDLDFPTLARIDSQELLYPINRDQVVLAFAGLSVDRTHKSYDTLLLFDQVFGGGMLGGMNSRLFALRERTGLFYTISGSLLARSSVQPGLALVKTIVSCDRLQEAEIAIARVIDQAADDLTAEELEEAKRAVLGSMVDNFECARQMAATFLFLRRYNFAPDYFDRRAEYIESITRRDITTAVKGLLDTSKMARVKIGRV